MKTYIISFVSFVVIQFLLLIKHRIFKRKNMNHKFSKKHIAIINTIKTKGKYKPTYSDQEPALTTLIKKGIVEWKGDYSGVVLTEFGKQLKTV